jgi:hypothetical protein
MNMKQPHNIPVDGRPHGLKHDRAYKLAHDYSYVWEHKGRKYRIFIPAGLVYDGASVPRFAWSITGLRPDGLLRAAALVHDFIYIHEGDMPPGTWQKKVSGKWADMETDWKRKQADRMFGRLLREAGVSGWRRRIAYKAVRAAGWIMWRE